MRSTTAHGLTMNWKVSRGRIYNAANPFTLYGYINGVCRLQCGISARTASKTELLEKTVLSRLSQIAREEQR